MTRKTPRILLVDDNRSIHEDFKQILNPPALVTDAETRALDDELFGESSPRDAVPDVGYEIDDAYQGEEAIAMVEQAYQQGRPYWLIFMDVRMPPGLDGIQTILKIWEKHPFVEMVLAG